MYSVVVCMCLATSSHLGQNPTPIPGPPLVPEIPRPAGVALPSLPVDICNFAQAFKTVEGTHEVLFMHPVKKCPVLVSFSLPPGCPKVLVGKRDLVFDYGRHSVSIKFRILCGKVSVLYS